MEKVLSIEECNGGKNVTEEGGIEEQTGGMNGNKEVREENQKRDIAGYGVEEGNQTGGKGLENLSRGTENGEREDTQSDGVRRENEEERKKNDGNDVIFESNEEVLGEQKTNVEEDIEEGEMVESWSDVTPEKASKSSSSLKFSKEKLLTPSRFSALLEVDENGDKIKPIKMEKVLSIEECNGGKNVTEEGGIEEQTGGMNGNKEHPPY
ncbi:hypothetical protein F2Q69_00058296 [Brassica cretica]|uniref:Uncharacterized protein n=1 Tax=Brassica cretica TaxID=69181 RepID=A0A8S9RI04_BRACR|nr:hypothetical protein F2Q69_00058296 [Brassica cretica]